MWAELGASNQHAEGGGGPRDRGRGAISQGTPLSGATGLLCPLLGAGHPLVARPGPAATQASPVQVRASGVCRCWQPAYDGPRSQGRRQCCLTGGGQAPRVLGAEPRGAVGGLHSLPGFPPRTPEGASLRWQAQQRQAARVTEREDRLPGLRLLPPLLHVPSGSGSLCLQPLPQRGLLYQHPGPRLPPLHLPCGLHRQGLRHR